MSVMEAVRRRGNPRAVAESPKTEPPGRAAGAVTAAPEPQARWVRPGFWVLMPASALMYFWNLSVSGYANSFYAAAVKSGTQSWKALLFGSIDSANAITVDKPPAALWLMSLSGRIFGFSSWSMLAPEALMGVGTVALMYLMVKRWAGPAYGLLAGALVLATPVATLMFRFNNPDALLVFAMTAAAYCVTRAVDSERRPVRWLLGAGALVGLAFLTKLMQGMLVLPAFGLVYLLASSRGVGARIRHLIYAFVAFVIGGGWFVALVSWWPASSRPYIGGSTDNSLWELAMGYNGLGRILGENHGSSAASAGGGGGANFSGTAGVFRLFNSQMGPQISWFLPAAVVLLVGGLVARGRLPRTDRVRAGLVLWGAWTLVNGVVFSFMEGTVHPYYTVALAPGIAGVIAFGGAALFARRARLWARVVIGVAVIAAAAWTLRLLHGYASDWNVWLGYTGIAVAVLGSMVFVALGTEYAPRLQRIGTGALALGIVGAILGSAVWSLATVNVSHTDSNPKSGPAAAASSGMGAGPGGGAPSGTTARSGESSAAPSGAAGGAPSGSASAPSNPSSGSSRPSAPGGAAGSAPSGAAGSAGTGSTGTGSSQTANRSAQGGMGGGSQANAQVVSLLNSAGTKWSAATVGAQSAAPYILNSNTAVMAIGGFTGSDNSISLAQFQADVKAGQIHYFIAGGGMGGGPGGSTGDASQITAWVKAHYTAKTVGGVTVYDLTSAKS